MATTLELHLARDELALIAPEEHARRLRHVFFHGGNNNIESKSLGNFKRRQLAFWSVVRGEDLGHGCDNVDWRNENRKAHAVIGVGLFCKRLRRACVHCCHNRHNTIDCDVSETTLLHPKQIWLVRNHSRFSEATQTFPKSF